jgi:hypothetical protein
MHYIKIQKQLLRSVMSIEDLQPADIVKPVYLNIADQQVYFNSKEDDSSKQQQNRQQPPPKSFEDMIKELTDNWDERIHRGVGVDVKRCVQAQAEIDRRLKQQRQSDDFNPQGDYLQYKHTGN